MLVLNQVLLYGTELLALATAVALIVGVRIKPAFAWGAALVGCLSFVLLTYLQYPPGKDVRIFWETGRTVWDGANPYSDKCINPPTALPLYLALATLPFPVLLAGWTALSVALGLALVWLAQHVLQAQEAEAKWKLPGIVLAVLTSTAALSFAVRYGVELGQIALLNTAFLFVALYAQGRGRPGWAGFWLALATIKISLMLPFLVLFHRKEDRKTWLTLGATTLGLCLVCTSGVELPQRLRDCLHNIGELGGPGKINDYSYLNQNNIENFGFDHALFRLGIRDRQMVQGMQLALLALVGGWIAWNVVRNHWSPAAACAVVAFYAAVFLYHRVYDMSILFLPLVYTAGRARSEHGAARWLFALSALSILAVLYLRVGVLRSLTGVVPGAEGIAYRLLEALILPYGTWLVLFGMMCLAAGERLLREPISTRLALARAA
jgi:hypothetical protein